MKYIIPSMLVLVLAGLLLTGSCQRDGAVCFVEDGALTYTVKVPHTVATKDGAESFTVYYEVYRQAELAIEGSAPLYRGQKAIVDGSADIQIDFVKEQSYIVLFWAQNASAPYEINDLRRVTLKSLRANEADAEAFAGTDQIVKGVSLKNSNVVLERPVAQLSISTLTSALDMGNGTPAGIKSSEVKVKKLYRVYNVASGSVCLEDEITYAQAEVSAEDTDPEYTPVSINYIGFMPETGTTVDVDFTVYMVSGEQITHSVSNVPVRPNYRTNIFGNLVTGSTIYNVTVDESWTDDKNVNSVEKEGVARISATKYETLQAAFDEVYNTETEVVLLKDVELTETAILAEGKTAVLDLNGFTLSIADVENKYALANLGTLTIKDSKGGGSVNARGIYNSYNPYDFSRPTKPAELTIEGGTYNCLNPNFGSAVNNYGKVELSGGTYNSKKGYALVNQQESSMTIYDGVIVNNGIDNISATLIIHGGRFVNHTSDQLVNASFSSLEIYGGTFIGTFSLISTNLKLAEGYELNSQKELVKK